MFKFTFDCIPFKTYICFIRSSPHLLCACLVIFIILYVSIVPLHSANCISMFYGPIQVLLLLLCKWPSSYVFITSYCKTKCGRCANVLSSMSSCNSFLVEKMFNSGQARLMSTMLQCSGECQPLIEMYYYLAAT